MIVILSIFIRLIWLWFVPIFAFVVTLCVYCALFQLFFVFRWLFSVPFVFSIRRLSLSWVFVLLLLFSFLLPFWFFVFFSVSHFQTFSVLHAFFLPSDVCIRLWVLFFFPLVFCSSCTSSYDPGFVIPYKSWSNCLILLLFRNNFSLRSIYSKWRQNLSDLIRPIQDFYLSLWWYLLSFLHLLLFLS